MNIPAPHFLLFSEARGKDQQGQWRFVLQAADGSATFEAADFEPETVGERLELLAVVRGLEALDQPSNVTLFTPSKYVNRGIAYGLEEWRRNEWTWERYGEMVPVKNGDLWQRIDRALSYHHIEFRGFRFDGPHLSSFQGAAAPEDSPAEEVCRASPEEDTFVSTAGWRATVERVQHRLRDRLEGWKLSCLQLGTCFLPKPWIG